jgi:hypothetical protein
MVRCTINQPGACERTPGAQLPQLFVLCIHNRTHGVGALRFLGDSLLVLVGIGLSAHAHELEQVGVLAGQYIQHLVRGLSGRLCGWRKLCCDWIFWRRFATD